MDSGGGVIAAVIVLGLIVAALLVLRDRERQAHEKTTRSLLDRIQHPERTQVEAGPIVEYDPPKDTAELAHVGEIVPEFISVGGSD